MSKRTSRIMSLSLALVLLITPVAVLANGGTATIEGIVFNDANQNGVFDGLEEGIDGVTVELFTGEASLIGSATTASDGFYEFLSLVDGDYTVSVADIAGKVDSTPNLVDFTVDGSTEVPTVDFGKVSVEQLGSISGTVYDDRDRSRGFSTGDVGIENVDLKLLDADGSEINAVKTNHDGDYIFEDVLAGNYTVVEIDPSTYYSTTPNQVLVTLGVGGALEDKDFFDFVPEEGEVPRIDLMLMKFFDLTLLDFQALRALDGWGYGNIAKAYFIAQRGDTSLVEILGMRETMGWGEIMQAVLGRAGLKGYNLGLIVSGKEVPSSIQNLIDGCDLIESEEQVQELLSLGGNNGSIKKACKLAQEVGGGDFDTLVEALGLLGDHTQKQVREILLSGASIQANNANGGNNDDNGNHGPPACKGKNKNNPGCN